MHDGDSSFKSFESFTFGQEKGLLKIHPIAIVLTFSPNNNAIYFVDSARTKFFTHSSPIN